MTSVFVPPTLSVTVSVTVAVDVIASAVWLPLASVPLTPPDPTHDVVCMVFCELMLAPTALLYVTYKYSPAPSADVEELVATRYALSVAVGGLYW